MILYRYRGKKSNFFENQTIILLFIMSDLANLDENESCCDIPFKTRVILGVICGALGALFTFLSFIEFTRQEWTAFAIIYTLGSIAALASSFFIAGPKAHIKQLKEKEHLISAIVVLVSMVLVFIFALAVKSIGLTILFVIIQLLGLIVYYITLTTLGLTAFRAFIRKVFPCCA